jgi:hypothetical protein
MSRKALIEDTQHFWLYMETSAIANGASETQNALVGQDADFLLLGIAVEATSWDDTTVEMKAGQIYFMNSPIPLKHFAGTMYQKFGVASSVATAGYYRPVVGQRLASNSTISCTFANSSGAPNTIKVTFEGIKLYRPNEPVFSRLPGGTVVRL